MIQQPAPFGAQTSVASASGLDGHPLCQAPSLTACTRSSSTAIKGRTGGIACLLRSFLASGMGPRPPEKPRLMPILMPQEVGLSLLKSEHWAEGFVSAILGHNTTFCDLRHFPLLLHATPPHWEGGSWVGQGHFSRAHRFASQLTADTDAALSTMAGPA